MITMIRIDDRLLHGQVAYSWKSALGYDAIVIGSDAAANDEMRKSALKLAVPTGVRLAVREVKDAAKLTKHEKLQAMKVLVIVASTKDALDFLKEIDEKPTLNIGGIQMSGEKRAFSKAVYMEDEDITNLDAIEEMGITIKVQEVPSTPVYNYRDFRDKFVGGN